MIETLEHPISLHILSSFRLTFFFGMAFSATSRVTSQGAVWAKGLRVATQESGVAGVAVRGGVDGPAARRSARVHCSGGYVPCRVLSYAMTMWEPERGRVGHIEGHYPW